MLFESFKRMRTERSGEAAFLVASGDRSVPISWRQFTDDIDLVARIIRSRAPGAKVALLGENSYEWMVAHAALLFSGATAVPLDVNLTAAEIVERLTEIGSSTLIYSSLYIDKAREVRRLMPVVYTAAFGSLKTERFLERFRLGFSARESIWTREEVPCDQTSMIVFTSGTTLKPRGVELTIRALEEFVSAWSRALELQAGRRSLMLLPLYHIFGICSDYLMLASGVALGVCPDFRRLYDATERFRVNFLFLVPALADILATKIERRGKSAEEALGTPIDWILVGGAPMPRRTFERLFELGVKVIAAYGLTETCALYSVTPADGDAHVGSAGRVPVGSATEARVSDDGELLLKSPAVMKGYYGDPKRTAQVIDADGWFHTGDRGRIDEEGFVWITGRISRTIVLSSGKKIAPEELEERILRIPGIREVLVSGEAETRQLKAEVYGVLSPEAAKQAIGRMNLLLPVYKRVNVVEVRDTPFPRTSSGKIKAR